MSLLADIDVHDLFRMFQMGGMGGMGGGFPGGAFRGGRGHPFGGGGHPFGGHSHGGHHFGGFYDDDDDEDGVCLCARVRCVRAVGGGCTCVCVRGTHVFVLSIVRFWPEMGRVCVRACPLCVLGRAYPPLHAVVRCGWLLAWLIRVSFYNPVASRALFPATRKMACWLTWLSSAFPPPCPAQQCTTRTDETPEHHHHPTGPGQCPLRSCLLRPCTSVATHHHVKLEPILAGGSRE